MFTTSFRHLGRSTALCLMILAGVSVARAQLVSDGDSLVLNGLATNLIPANLILGNAGSNTRLVLTNSGRVDDVSGFLGFLGSSSTNQLTVNGSGSVWNNSGNVNIGNAGDFNTLLLTSGGQVTNGFASIGDAAGSDHNQVIVNGTGSVWDNSGFIAVGYSGSFNSLFATNGGVVNSSGGYVGYNPGTADNQATVSGANSVWNSSLELSIGESGVRSTLLITNSGSVSSPVGFIGRNLGSDNNQVTVTGAGSTWTDAGTLSAGESGSFNSLLIANGGVLSSAFCAIGYNDTAFTNQAIVSGAGSFWAGSGNLYVGNFGSFSTLIITNSGVVSNNLNGTVGVRMDSAGSRAIVTGPGSTWSAGGNLSAGDQGVFNTLLITNGGLATSTEGYVGRGGNGATNLAIVAGTNSTWLTSSMLAVGNFGSYNTLLITGGGQVLNDSILIGQDTDASNNRGIVSGAGSLWSSPLTLTVGDFGSFNGLVITNGGSVINSGGLIGNNLGANANQATINGTGSTWVTGDFLLIGGSGSFNQLVITNGGKASSTNGYIGIATSAAANQVTVSGNNSLWSLDSTNFVGVDGSFNSLLITNGGRVTNAFGYIGYGVSSSSNLATVAGSGSAWINDTLLSVGDSGAFNTLVITNGGRVTNNAAGYVGYLAGAANNQAIVTGTNSGWSLIGTPYVGYGGISNALIINNGGSVFNLDGVIGFAPISSNNSAIVAGGGALWTNRGDLYLGYEGSFNTLFITNAGTVFNDRAFFSFLSTASNNQAIVSGPNSTWNNRSDLRVGASGPFNRLVVSNSGTVFAANGVYLGFNPSSVQNRATVSGGTLRATNAAGTAVVDVRRGTNVFNSGLIETDKLLLTNTAGVFEFNGGTLITRGGSVNNGQNFVVGQNSSLLPATWDVRSNTPPTVLANGLIIGANGAGASLLITNGATLSNAGGVIGQSSSANLATISGLSSIWNNSGSVAVGSFGSFNTLLATKIGKVLSASGVVGESASSLSNRVVVGDVGSAWTIAGDLSVGNNGAFNSLVITNSGAVSNGLSYLGRTASGNSNSAAIGGLGSRWTSSSSAYIGSNGSYNILIITNGGKATTTAGVAGDAAGALRNRVIVGDTNSFWISTGEITIGNNGSFNTLLITNGGAVSNVFGYLGRAVTGNSNQVTVSGAGSLWTNGSSLSVGEAGDFNALFITNGGTVISPSAHIGFLSGANGNQVVVGDNNSAWRVSTGLNVGRLGSTNSLLILNGGTVNTANLNLGAISSSLGNSLLVQGTLRVTNGGGTGVFSILGGTNFLNGGLMEVDSLSMSAPLGQFQFNSGTLNILSATVANGTLFTIGNGSSVATYNMAATNTHAFSSGLRIANNAIVTGNGNLNTVLTVASGGTLSPGSPIGRIVLFFPPVLQGNIALEIGRSGVALANDRVDVSTAMTYGGALTVTSIGPDPLVAGNSFQLFSAPGYSGAFSTFSLPSLTTGLSWTNRLLLNGTIAVVNKSAPNLAALTKIGTNLVYTVTGGSPGAPWFQLTSTNVALPLANWATNASGVFDWLGNVSLTNGMSAAEPHRFFRIYAP